MNIKFKFILISVFVILLSACTSNPLKAPCDQYGNFCGNKTKINQW